MGQQMLRRFLFASILTLLLFLSSSNQPLAAEPDIEQHLFIEEFSSHSFMDDTATTADWDIVGRIVRKNSTNELIDYDTITGQLPLRGYGRTTIYAPETGLAYIFGGRLSSGPDSTRDVMVFDPMTGITTLETNVLPKKVAFSAGVHVPELETIFLLGGGDGGWSTDIIAFDTASGTASMFGNLPRKVMGASAVYVPEQRLIYYFGGLRTSVPIREIGVFDPFNNEGIIFSTQLPVDRFYGPLAYLQQTGTISLYGSGNTYSQGYPDPWIVEYAPLHNRVRVAEERLPREIMDSAYALVPDQDILYIFDTRGRRMLQVDTRTGTVSQTSFQIPNYGSYVRATTAFYAANRHALYMVGGGWLDEHILRVDFGYVTHGTAQSRRVNRYGTVISATLMVDQYVPASQTLSYQLSNDGGQKLARGYPRRTRHF